MLSGDRGFPGISDGAPDAPDAGLLGGGSRGKEQGALSSRHRSRAGDLTQHHRDQVREGQQAACLRRLNTRTGAAEPTTDRIACQFTLTFSLDADSTPGCPWKGDFECRILSFGGLAKRRTRRRSLRRASSGLLHFRVEDIPQRIPKKSPTEDECQNRNHRISICIPVTEWFPNGPYQPFS